MKHNFPEGVSIACTHVHNLKEGKEILKLAIDGDCLIYKEVLSKIVDKEYERFYWDKDDKYISQTCAEINDNEYIWVSFEEFKAFLQGKGKCNLPFKQDLKLSDSYTATVTKDNVKVGCQTFTHNTIKLLYQLSLKAQKP